jgi:hypothetical protein
MLFVYKAIESSINQQTAKTKKKNLIIRKKIPNHSTSQHPNTMIDRQKNTKSSIGMIG